MHAVLAIHQFVLLVTHLLANGPDANLTNIALQDFGTPATDIALVCIPAAIGMNAITKLSEHRETAMGLVVDIVVKGGGAVGAIMVFKAVSGM